MVNYCCVAGCGRNNRTHGHLNYYTLPKDPAKQRLWLKAAFRDDLLEHIGDKNLMSYRICSRHFSPTCLKNRHLASDAVPTLNLKEGECDNEQEKPYHEGILCNVCHSKIHGFRYKCVTCPDYDLCQKCEMHDSHPEHYMVRIPKVTKYKKARQIINKVRGCLATKKGKGAPDINVGNVACGDTNSSEDDDAPITEYLKRKHNMLHLSNEVKKNIQLEVIKALKLADNIDVRDKEKSTTKSQQRKMNDTEKRKGNDNVQNNSNVPEIEFANVNDVSNFQVLVHRTKTDEGNELPGTSIMINDALSEFLIKKS